MKKPQYKPLVMGLAESPSIVINGVDYTGSYLAMMVAIRDSTGEEAKRTVQLIAELGRLSALAHKHLKMKEAAYRAWRDGMVHRLTNSVSEAAKAGFECAANPGKDAKGKDKPAKTPATSSVEQYMRTVPEYRDHQLVVAEAEEAWATIHAAVEAAKQRIWVLRVVEGYEGGIEGDNNRLVKAVDSTKDTPIPTNDKRTTAESGSAKRTGRKGPPPPPQLKR